MSRMRPFVIVNCAMTADGKIAGRCRRQVRISSQEDLDRVKVLRASCDAILVGVETILADDPHLTVGGHPPERNPLRIILDSNGRTPDEAKALDSRARTLIATADACSRTWAGAETIRCGRGRVDLAALLPALSERGVKRLLVEGGGEVISSFFEGGFVDRYCIFLGSLILGGRDSPTPVDGEGFPDDQPRRLRLTEVTRLGDGALLSYEVLDDNTKT